MLKPLNIYKGEEARFSTVWGSPVFRSSSQQQQQRGVREGTRAHKTAGLSLRQGLTLCLRNFRIVLGKYTSSKTDQNVIIVEDFLKETLLKTLFFVVQVFKKLAYSRKWNPSRSCQTVRHSNGEKSDIYNATFSAFLVSFLCQSSPQKKKESRLYMIKRF